jgi:hypothetical protein
MTTRRSAILARVLALLVAGNTMAADRVFRARSTAMTRDESPALAIYLGPESVSRMGQESDRHELLVRVNAYVRGDPWDDLAEQLIEQVQPLVTTDEPLRELATDVRLIAVEPDSEDADTTAGVMQMTFQVTYITRAWSLT